MKRKKLLFAGLAAGVGALTTTSSEAQTITAFTPGDVVVYRVGTGTALTNAGTAVFLDEYNPTTGNLDGSMALSTLATPLVASGTAGSEGLLNLSANGQYLVATGYDAAVGTTNTGNTSITGTTSTAVPREVATVSGTGAVVQTTINNYSANNIRSAASPDGTTIYTSGANTGILQVVSGASNTTGTLVSATITGGTALTNTRAIGIYNGQLLFSTGAGTTRIDTLGSASAPAGPAAPLPGISSTSINAPYQFAAVTLTLGGTTSDTLYVADNGAGLIQKFSLVGGTFTLTGTVALAGVTGLTAEAVAGGELLVVTTTANIETLTDTSGAGGTLNGTLTNLVTAATNEAFRGDAFAPSLVVTGVPEPSTWAATLLGAIGLGGLLRLRRRRAARA